jgi:hypothetical protein
LERPWSGYSSLYIFNFLILILKFKVLLISKSLNPQIRSTALEDGRYEICFFLLAGENNLSCKITQSAALAALTIFAIFGRTLRRSG